MSPKTKVTVALPSAELDEIEQSAAERGVTSPQIIRERLSQWRQQQSLDEQANTKGEEIPVSPLATPPMLSDQLGQLEEQLEDVQQLVQQLLDRSSAQPDPQIRSALQPVHTRLQSLEAQMGVIKEFLQQMLQEGNKRQFRLELWLEAIYIMVSVALLDNHPEELLEERKAWLDELQERLEHHFKENQ